MKEKIENKDILITVNSSIVKIVKDKIKNGAIEGLSFEKKVRQKDNKATLLFKVDDSHTTRQHYLSIGMQLERLKAQSWLVVKGEDSKLLKSKENVFPIQVDSSLVEQFVKDYAEDVKYKSKKVSGTGEKTVLYFRADDLHSRKDLIKRIALIFDAIRSVKNKVMYRKFDRFKTVTLRNLEENGSHVTIDKLRYKEMTGEELVANGYALGYPHETAKDNSIISKAIYAAKSVGQNHDYYYQGSLVIPTAVYVVRLREPMPLESPVPINYNYEIDMAWRYGEQKFRGGGVDEIDAFQKEIIAMINEANKDAIESMESLDNPTMKVIKDE